jgi:hypothetical protein
MRPFPTTFHLKSRQLFAGTTIAPAIIVATFEQLINTEDCFTQVSLYQLLREDGRVFIFVHKIIAGPGKGSFMAHPTHLVGRHKDEYVGTGKSRDIALRDCLARIKGVATKDMADVQSH